MLHATPPSNGCATPACRAAYAVIARALPRDKSNRLAKIILRTPGFDYDALNRALGIATPAQIAASVAKVGK